MNISQWNLNGFRTHYKELQIIIKEHIPTIIALQETNFKDENYGNNIKSHTEITKNRIGARLASGGVATYIRNDIKATEVQIQTTIYAIANQVIPFRCLFASVTFTYPIATISNETKSKI